MTALRINEDIGSEYSTGLTLVVFVDRSLRSSRITNKPLSMERKL